MKIDKLIPLLRPGWVAMNKYGNWFWFKEKPTIQEIMGLWVGVDRDCYNLSSMFDIEPVKDWTNSLRKVG